MKNLWHILNIPKYIVLAIIFPPLALFQALLVDWTEERDRKEYISCAKAFIKYW